MAFIMVPAGTTAKTKKHALALRHIQHMTSTTPERQAGHWIPVPSAEWKSMLGERYYTGVLYELEQAGYVEINDRYSSGRFCKSYRLSARYRTPKRTVVYFKGKDLPAEPCIRLKANDTAGHRLAKWLTSVEIPEEVAAKANGWQAFIVDTMQRGSFYARRCEYGRFHSQITVLKKEIRHHLTIKGHATVECDVKNCQPTLLAKLASSKTREGTNRAYTICGDILDFQAVCERGEIYETILDQCRQIGYRLRDFVGPEYHRYYIDRPLTAADRDRIKKQFVVCMFCEIGPMRKLPAFRALATRWPSVADYLVSTKEAEGYQAIAERLQKAESTLMIDGAACELAREIPLVTIHDSILCRQSDQERVRKCIQRHWSQAGLAVTVKSK